MDIIVKLYEYTYYDLLQCSLFGLTSQWNPVSLNWLLLCCAWCRHLRFSCMWNGITLHFPPLPLITVTCSPEDHISPTLLFLLLLACDKRRSFLSLFYPQRACIVCFIHILPEFSVIVADFQGMSSQVQSRSRRSFLPNCPHEERRWWWPRHHCPQH